MSVYKYSKQLRQKSEELLRMAEGMLNDRSSFAPFDPAKDAEVKAAIRIYVQSWVIPPAKELYEELTKLKGGGR